jgi:hypothetical protein
MPQAHRRERVEIFRSLELHVHGEMEKSKGVGRTDAAG